MARLRGRVLVVEEDALLRERIASDLAAHGFDVTSAPGADLAQRAAHRGRFDVVLSGLSDDAARLLVPALKGVDPELEIVSVAASTRAMTSLVCGGAFACVTKPYDMQDVRALLDRAVQSRARLYSCVTLFEVSRALLATLKQADLVALVIELADRVMLSDRVALLLTGAATTAGFECHVSAGRPEVPRAVIAALAASAASAGQSVAAPIDGLLLHPAADDAGIRTAVACPLATPEGIVGAVCFFRGAGAPAFSQVEIERGEAFASQVALALENARTYRELEEKMSELVRNGDRARLRSRLSLVGAMGSVLAHEMNNPLTVLACNLDTLKSTADDLWGVAKSAAEFLREQSEPTGTRLSRNAPGAAGERERTDRLVTEVVAAIDECLEGVQRIAELVRALSEGPLPQQEAPATFRVADLVERLVVSREGGARKLAAPVRAPELVAMGSERDVRAALTKTIEALDRLVSAQREPIVLGAGMREGRPALTITDRSLDASMPGADAATQSERVTGLGRRVAVDVALAAAARLLDRNGAELMLEPLPEGGSRLWLVLAAPAEARGAT
jgi:DNA-binding response OmpR family regulator